jgi:hypothetical protein
MSSELGTSQTVLVRVGRTRDRVQSSEDRPKTFERG